MTSVDGLRKGNPEERAVKNTTVMEFFRSGDTTSKYHQSHEVELMAEIFGLSRKFELDVKIPLLSPVATVDGMILCSESRWGLYLGDRQATETLKNSTRNCVRSDFNIVSVLSDAEKEEGKRCIATEALYLEQQGNIDSCQSEIMG